MGEVQRFNTGESPFYLREYFDGLKDGSIHRLGLFFDSIRKILLVTLLIFFEATDKYIRISIFSGIQLIYTIFVIFVKPYELTRDNIREGVSEVMVSTFALALFYFNDLHQMNEIAALVFQRL